MNAQREFRQTIHIAAILLLLLGCSTPAAQPEYGTTQRTETPPSLTRRVASTPNTTPAGTDAAEGLSNEDVATLNSLEQVDDYPLYTMHFFGRYATTASPDETSNGKTYSSTPPSPPSWACSLFAALAGADGRLFGRNFDWEFSPAMLLFTAPTDGYASVSMVAIAYLGFAEAEANGLTDLPVGERRALLDAPLLPFDGMNEHGLVVGMAAVPPGLVQPDPDQATIGSLRVIRELLDHARDVQQAVDILQSYNIDWSGGPPLHYLIADASGRAALVEFFQGAMVVIPNDAPWHQATNFLRAAAGKSAQGQCWRYDSIAERLAEAGGCITPADAMALLEDVAQDGTQWSVVYEMSKGQVNVAMGRAYEDGYTFTVGTSGRWATGKR
jgi:hypothetical protein